MAAHLGSAGYAGSAAGLPAIRPIWRTDAVTGGGIKNRAGIAGLRWADAFACLAICDLWTGLIALATVGGIGAEIETFIATVGETWCTHALARLLIEGGVAGAGLIASAAVSTASSTSFSTGF